MVAFMSQSLSGSTSKADSKTSKQSPNSDQVLAAQPKRRQFPVTKFESIFRETGFSTATPVFANYAAGLVMLNSEPASEDDSYWSLFFCALGVFEHRRVKNPILHATCASNFAHLVMRYRSLDSPSIQYNRYVMPSHRVLLCKVGHQTISGLVLCGLVPGSGRELNTLKGTQ